jgi:hypothetical protein
MLTKLTHKTLLALLMIFTLMVVWAFADDSRTTIQISHDPWSSPANGWTSEIAYGSPNVSQDNSPELTGIYQISDHQPSFLVRVSEDTQLILVMLYLNPGHRLVLAHMVTVNSKEIDIIVIGGMRYNWTLETLTDQGDHYKYVYAR